LRGCGLGHGQANAGASAEDDDPFVFQAHSGLLEVMPDIWGGAAFASSAS
jgi:hypothetical protein